MFFFFKQKTAYELRISDWSSDVCSSDLAFGKPDEDRLADQKMADVQLDDLRNRGDWLDIVVGQPMTRMHLYPVLGRKRRRIGEALQLGRPGMVLKMRVEPGVQLDDGRLARKSTRLNSSH